ncbi:MAG TPA: alpha/beta hydrolase [Anaerolineae bacterium]|nr:alpha/beta hydrolase [Anaerolineae bacterium]
MAKITNPDPKIEKLYKDVPQESLRRLQAFREHYPYQTLQIKGRPWRFIDTREGETALFIPAGGTTVAEVSFMSLVYFAQEWRVIAPDYPPVDSLKELFTGFIEMLNHLGVGQFYAMGGSYGGWMVQSLVRHYPERVRKMVITAIGPPDPENGQQIAKMMRWLPIMPTFLLRALINRSFSRLMSDRTGDQNVSMLWALLREVMYYRVKREDLIAALQRLVDQTQNYTFSPDDLRDWTGSMLVLFGSEDPATPPEKREAMRALYPRAELKVFEGGEHGIAFTHQVEYYAAIDEFLAKE